MTKRWAWMLVLVMLATVVLGVLSACGNNDPLSGFTVTYIELDGMPCYLIKCCNHVAITCDWDYWDDTPGISFEEE